MKQNEVYDKLTRQKDSIDVIEKQLRWILSECQKKNAKPGTKFGDEMIQRFYSLYRDFVKIKDDATKLADEVSRVEFNDEIMGLVYKTTANLLLQRCSVGIFRQFTSVAETGKLPECS